MNVAPRFRTLGWTLDGPVLSLNYGVGEMRFREEITFPRDVDETREVAAVCDLLAAVAGVSYAKAFAPVDVDVLSSHTDEEWNLLTAVYGPGMAEFAFHQAMNAPFRLVRGQREGEHVAALHDDNRTSVAQVPRPVIPLGAGRDSCLVATALRPSSPTLLSIGGAPAAKAVAEALGCELVVVTRRLDSRLFELNAAGAPNGHVPVTAINSLISLVYAVAVGSDAVVMANEESASEPTRVVNGVAVNHQYSKSLEFERLLASALRSRGIPVSYFSVLRGRSDDDIARVFASRCQPLHRHFVSCNRAALIDQSRRTERWCGQCPKCRSMFLSLAPYMSPDEMRAIFGSDLLADEGHIEGFAELLDDDTKPFECVQTVAEARDALGQLSRNPLWASHQVVLALSARLGGVREETLRRQRAGRDVPEPYAAMIDQFFEERPRKGDGQPT